MVFCTLDKYMSEFAVRNGDRKYPNIHVSGKIKTLAGCLLINIESSHPNVIQLYGIVSSSGIHATIFHDGGHLSFSKRVA